MIITLQQTQIDTQATHSQHAESIEGKVEDDLLLS